MTTDFAGLGLAPELVQAVTELGYAEPTPIQSAVIPLLLDGRDVIGQAQTGTGKTAAFALPIVQTIEPAKGPAQSLILAPTRELAMQVAHNVHEYGRHRGVRVLAVYGGQPYERQIRRLEKGVDVVVGTPGRLLDLIRQGALDLGAVSTVVLDEADEMLSMGFIEDIEAILGATPETRQTALFSATMPPEIRRLAERYMRDPESATVGTKQRTVDALEQRYYLLHHGDKFAALTRLLEVEQFASTLIFVRTRAGTGELASELTARGFPAEALSGDLSQESREQTLQRFRRGQNSVLVATDVAARGLDIDDISHVVNYDLPTDPEAYVHRVGRTGRAGKAGIAISLVAPDEQWLRRKIEAFSRQEMTRCTLPSVVEIERRRDERLRERMLESLALGHFGKERALVAELVEAGQDPLDVAAVALKMARVEAGQRHITPIKEVEEFRPREARRAAPQRELASSRRRRGDHEEGMVRLSLNAGRAHGIRPNDVVGSIAHHADIPGYSIGAIRIQEQHTLFDVPEQFVAQVLAKAGSYRIRKHPVAVERAR
jgi:ATP-dependent RNA helicase DeaD